MSELPSKDKIEAAFDAALAKHNDLIGIDEFVLDELGIPHDGEEALLRHINNVVFDLIGARGLLKEAVVHRPADPAIAEEASTAGYAAGTSLSEAERKRIEESVAPLEYRSSEEGQKIGDEGKIIARKIRPDLPENHAWHRYFSYGFWAALRPQDGPFAQGQVDGDDLARTLWRDNRAMIDAACDGLVRHSEAEYQALRRLAGDLAVKCYPDLFSNRDWMAGLKQVFTMTLMDIRAKGF